MAAKRFFDDSEIDDPTVTDDTKPNDKRIRPNRPSFASVIGEVVMVNNLHNLFSGLEPLLRRVINEEVERVISRQNNNYPLVSMMTRSYSSSLMRIQAPMEQPSHYALIFTNKLTLPIFTGTRLLDIDGNPITVILVDKTTGHHFVPTSLPYPIKLELVVLDGDFPPNQSEQEESSSSWTTEEFNRHIVKERSGRRPLLAGEVNITLRDGRAAVNGDIEFTDNSSWIRSRKFRVAVRVAPGGNSNHDGLRIREGITEAFIVKDHRGELYKKHHPPMLKDEVWRLEKIGKDGAFHKKLSAEGINTVQDFLKLSVVDSHRLRKILGVGMSEKMWDVTMKHAKTCKMGNKLYIDRGPNYTLFLNPICQMIRADIDGQIFPGREINNINRSYMEKLVREAYGRWNNLEEIDGVLNDNNAALLTQGKESSEQFGNNYDHNNNYYGDKSAEVVGGGNYVQSHNNNNNNNNNNSAQIECTEWPMNAATFSTSSFVNNVMPYNFTEPQSEGDITPSGSVIDGAVPRWN